MYSKKIIENAVFKGAKYLLDSQNTDGGIKLEDENSDKSGVWVTAETLEFFLTSHLLPTTVYERVDSMIKFIIDSQNSNGAWSIVNNDDPLSGANEYSTIATGHCVYVLKLALVGGFNTKKSRNLIRHSIQKGEQWLRKSIVQSGGCAFWGATDTVSGSINPNVNERSRMEYIFTTFYALMGLVNPLRYPDSSDTDYELIGKVYHFFIGQAEWFVNKYTSSLMLEGLRIVDFAKVASTICRIINAISLMGKNLSAETLNGLERTVNLCSQNPFMTTSITINTNKIEQYAATYNNNTPFDMGMALVNLGADVSVLEQIIDEYIKNQQIEGYWFLSFSSAYTIKTWTTSEALLVLERALEKYSEIKLKNVEDISSKRIAELNEKLKSISLYVNIATIISLILSVIIIIGMICISQNISESNPYISNIMLVLVIPFVINIIYDIIKTIKFYKN